MKLAKMAAVTSLGVGILVLAGACSTRTSVGGGGDTGGMAGESSGGSDSGGSGGATGGSGGDETGGGAGASSGGAAGEGSGGEPGMIMADSYVSEYAFADGTCCRDFGDISKNDGADNAYTSIITTIEGVTMVDVDPLLEDSLTSGDSVMVLRHDGAVSAENSSAYTATLFQGAFEGDTDYDSASMGTGTVTADTSRIEWTATIADGKLVATADEGQVLLMESVSDTFEYHDAVDLRLEGDIVENDDGWSLENATLSGYVTLATFREKSNEYLAAECSCLGVTGDVYTGMGDTWTTDGCEQIDSTCAEDDPCAAFDDGCQVLVNLFSGAADIDTNDDDEYDAISFGITLGAVPTVVVE